jgi:hypothetical protein
MVGGELSSHEMVLGQLNSHIEKNRIMVLRKNKMEVNNKSKCGRQIIELLG